VLVAVAAVALAGCGSDDDGDAKDNGAADAGASDAGQADAGATDTGDVQLKQRFHDHGQLIFLDVTDEDGATPKEFHAGHPLRITAILQPTKDFDGDIAGLSLQFGLVQKYEKAADSAKVITCYLGEANQHSGTISKNDDGTWTYVMEQLIPESCVAGLDKGKSQIFNVWAGINMPQEHHAGDRYVADGDYNTVFFNAQQVDLDGLDRAKNCKDRDGKAGCIYDLPIAPSPGPNVAVTRFFLESTLMPVHLASCGTGTVHADPGLSFELGLTLYGRDPHDGKTQDHATGNHLDDYLKSGEFIGISADICPLSDTSDQCAKGTKFERLHLTSRSADKTTVETAEQVKITSMRAGHEYIYGLDAHVDAMTTLCKRLTDPASADTWANHSHFRLKVCATPPFAEEGHSSDTDDDHCRVDVIRLVVMNDSGSGAAKSLGFKKTWAKKIGNSVVNGYADFGTDNSLNLSGARAHVWAKTGVGGWLHIPVADVEFDAAAQVAIVGSYMDGHVDVLGKRLYHYSKSIPEVELEYEKKWSKSYCITYNYGIAGIVLNASFCAGGGAGAKFDASIKAVEGSGVKPFADSTKIGVAEAGVTPFVDFNMSAKAELNLAIAKGGIKGTLTLVDVSLPTVGNLYWGLIKGPALVVTYGVTSKLNVELLHGDISVYVDLLKPKWCSCGSWCPGYPCAEWKEVVHKSLASFNGWKYGIKLLDKKSNKGLTLK